MNNRRILSKWNKINQKITSLKMIITIKMTNKPKIKTKI